MQLKLYVSIAAFIILFGCKNATQVSEEKVKEIHEKALTVDTHCDTPMNLLYSGFDIGVRNEAPKNRVDFPRMKEGGLDAIFFAAFTGQKPRTPENTQIAYERAHLMIDSTYSVCKKYSNMAEVAVTANDASRIEKEGKRAIYIGMENGFPIGTDLARVKEFYDRGVRYITLCHSFNNDICDSSTDGKGPEHNGLSEFGKQVVNEMNQLGMMIDVSHISDKSFFDVVSLSKAPVIASHSSVREIAHHNRNMTDEMIKKLAENKGVIQICLLDQYVKDPDTTAISFQLMEEIREKYYSKWEELSEEEKNAVRKKRDEIYEKYPRKIPTIADYVDHIDHVKNLVGIDYVGIGSDFDGGGGLEDCVDVSQFPNITREMLKRGYTEKEIEKVWGGNFFRVFKEVEELSSKIKM